MLTSWLHNMKIQGIPNAISNHPLSAMNVCTEFCHNPTTVVRIF